MIKNIMMFPNGMCAVFDEKGQQIPEFQGLYAEKYLIIDEQVAKQGFKPDIKDALDWFENAFTLERPKNEK